MLIVNPYTGQTLEDPWYNNIEPWQNGYLKVECIIRLREDDTGRIRGMYKHPNNGQFYTVQNPDSTSVLIVVPKESFYSTVFGQLNIRQVTRDNREEIKIKNMANKNESFIRLANSIFSKYPYGRPLALTSIVNKIKPKVQNNELDRPTRVANFEPEPILLDDDILYLSVDEIEEGLDNGGIYIDDETGDHRLTANDRLVMVGNPNGGRINMIRLRRPGISTNVFSRHIIVNGHYWPIKTYNYHPLENFNIPGYAIYEHDGNNFSKVITKNFDDIGINTLSPTEEIKAVVKHCKVKINSITDSATIFGRQTVKKKMMLNDKNNTGYDIVDIIPDYECAKDGTKRDIVIVKGDLNYKFSLSDLTIVFPFANTILKGIIPIKDKTLKAGVKAKIINDKNLKIGKGEIVTVLNIHYNYHQSSKTSNHTGVVTVADKGGNSFKVWSNCLKVI